MKITISGPAAAFDSDHNEITQVRQLKKLSGSKSADACVNYLDEEPLSEIGLIGGHLEFVFDADAKRLRILTEYHSPRKLKKRELDQLVEQTQGQWSDGIGEGDFADVEQGILLDACPIASGADVNDVRVEQFDDGVKVPAPRKSPLFNAAKKNDTAKLAKLLDDGEDINSRDRAKNTPLHEAIRAKSTEAAILLIERGAALDVPNKDHMTPLLVVSIHGRIEILEALLKAGADPEYCDPTDYTDHPPLQLACNRGHAEAVRLLVEHGADVNRRDNSGYTALMHLDADDAEIARFLVSRDADVDAINSMDEGMDETLKRATSA